MSAHVLLTGASGFLGRRVARRLVAAGYRLHALAREGTERSALDSLDVRWHAADLEDRASIGRALAAARAEAADAALDVVHCGALISYRTRDRALQQRVNVGGTRHVVDAAGFRDVRRLLHVSSVVTIGHACAGETLDERSPYNGAELHVDYVDTKRAAEQYALSAAGPLEVVVVNPGAIFGVAGPRSNSAYFLRRAAAGAVRVAPPGTVGVLGVEDAADGVLAALQRGRSGARYLLCESSLSLSELLGKVASESLAPESIARPPAAPPRVPGLVWRGLGIGARALDLVLPLQRLTPQSTRMLGAHFRVRSDRAREELGWSPRPIGEVLGETLEALGLRRAPQAARRERPAAQSSANSKAGP